MLKQLKHLSCYLSLLIFVFSLAACGGSGGGGSSAVTAPSSVAGKVYGATVTSGAGFFARTGTFTVNFSATQDTYFVTGDGVNVADSAGTYTYSANGNVGTVSIFDSISGNGSYVLTFTSTTSGTFLATAASDPASNQSGLFTLL